jgi:hypothetical protein
LEEFKDDPKYSILCTIISSGKFGKIHDPGTKTLSWKIWKNLEMVKLYRRKKLIWKIWNLKILDRIKTADLRMDLFCSDCKSPLEEER